MTNDVLTSGPPSVKLTRGYVVCIQGACLRFNRNLRGLCYELSVTPLATFFPDLAAVAKAIEDAKVPVTDDLSIKIL